MWVNWVNALRKLVVPNPEKGVHFGEAGLGESDGMSGKATDG